jgi:phosphatidyl-myo-inositol dimannoside synthase
LVPVRALTPSTVDRLRMLPIAMRLLPPLRRYADHAVARFGYRFYRSVYLPRLRRMIKETRPDVIHSMAGGYLGWAAQAAAIELGVPFVCTPFAHPRQWGDGPDDIAYYRRADAVIGLVPSDADYLASLGVPREKLHVIGVSPELPPSVNPALFRRRHGLRDGPIVLYVGRMVPHKGAAAVLTAAPEVWKTCPESQFVFIGHANQAEAAAFERCDQRIRFLGKVSLQEKADALAACDIFCMPSISEILPTVYLEAWSYSKPVVGGQARGLQELVEGNGGGIVASQDPRDVAAGVTRLLRDDVLRADMGRRGKTVVDASYSVPAVVGALLDLYRRAGTGVSTTGRDARDPCTLPLTDALAIATGTS